MLAYAAGEPEAFDELFARYGQKIYNLFVRSLGSSEIAKDLVQETFLRLIQARSRYRPDRSFASWLYTIAMNLLRDQYRRSKRQSRWMQDQGNAGEAAAACDRDEASLSNAPDDSRLQAVMEAVQRLPQEQRQVILLAKYQGLSYKEIGEVLGISEAAAKQRAYRALKQLRRELFEKSNNRR